MSKKVGLVAMARVGRVVLLGPAGESATGGIRWLCLCDCGREVILRGSRLLDGSAKSCGCLLREKNWITKRKREIAAHRKREERRPPKKPREVQPPRPRVTKPAPVPPCPLAVELQDFHGDRREQVTIVGGTRAVWSSSDGRRFKRSGSNTSSPIGSPYGSTVGMMRCLPLDSCEQLERHFGDLSSLDRFLRATRRGPYATGIPGSKKGRRR